MALHLFGKTHRYCSLDEPAVRDQAKTDPGLLLARFPPPVILDEIQYAPDILHAVKSDIDRHRTDPGRYVLTGSQIFPLMQGVTESLAGRAAVTSLLSMSLREVAGQPDLRRSWKSLLLSKRGVGDPAAAPVLMRRLFRGGFPEVALRAGVDVRLWHSSYVQTYLERDVRTLRGVSDLNDFQRFVFALAARAGNLINFQDLSRDLGVTGKTVKAWVSVLEASGQVLTLMPYHVSKGKRLVKRPKIYFLDTGTLAFLQGVTEPDQLFSGISSGPMFETAVLAQLHRLLRHHAEPMPLYFWRTASGHEVDFIIEDGQTLIPIEAKLTMQPTSRDAAGLEAFQKLFPSRSGRGLLVCLCRERFPLTRSVDAIPLGSF